MGPFKPKATHRLAVHGPITPPYNASRSTWSIALFVATLLTATSFAPALAQADEQAELKAAAAARKAEKLMAQGKIAEACSKLAESFELDPLASSALELGRCREKERKYASAYRAFEDALELAKEAKNFRQLSQARRKLGALRFRLARVTITLTSPAEGTIVTVSGLQLKFNAKNQGTMPVDAGTHEVETSAPGHVTQKSEFSIKDRQKKRITIGPLEKEKAAPKKEPTPAVAPSTPDTETEVETVSTPQPGARQGRIVVQVAVGGGLMRTGVDDGPLEELTGVAYDLATETSGQLLATCGDEATVPGAGRCEASFSSLTRALVGGQLFVGYAVHERIHIGGRAWGFFNAPEGFSVLGGPSLSARVTGPLWLGASFMLGAQEYSAVITQARGSVPPAYQPFNPADGIPIPLDAIGAQKSTIQTGLLYGGALHASLALLGSAPESLKGVSMPIGLLDGSLHAGVSVALMKVPAGLGLVAPAHVGYRFY